MIGSVAAGLFVAALASPFTLSIAVLILILGSAYSLWLKSTVLLGNLSIATTAALLYLLDLTNWRSLDSAVADGFLIVLLFILGDELFKTTEDLDGDAANGIRTIATRYGYRVPAVGVTCCWALLMAVFMASIGLQIGGFLFSLICLAVIGIPTGVSSLISLRASSAAISRAHIWWKISWTPGLIALAFIR
jgi:geranylgeranylglycerol-phosphate geranylgeranyltransferase